MFSVRAVMAQAARILLVEDDPGLRDTLAEVLSARGYEVTCAPDGRAALAELGVARPPPSVILLDLAMPVMDGWTFRAVQQRDPRLASIPTIVLSASLGDDPRDVEKLAADAMLPKPFDLNRLVEALERVASD
jgi:CheY-like chemotaxis protein